MRTLDRSVPPLGGFNLTFLALEVRRLFRNRRTVIVTLVVPVVFFFLFKTGRRGGALQAAAGPNYEALLMIGLAVYGAMLAATSGGAMVSIERAQGWSRQLRLTPLRPPAYIAIKLLTAMTLGLISVAAVFVVGTISGVHLPIGVLIASAALAWVGALVFAAFGLFMGYLLPTENIMQFIAPVLGILAFLGGLFVPLKLLPSQIQDIAPYTPVYGVVSIARVPLLGTGLDPTWLLNVFLWTAGFAVGAILLFRRDTRRT